MKSLSLLLLGSLLFFGCSGVKVVSDYDKTVDFSKYKTVEYYGWVEESDAILSRFDKERIEASFAQEFKSRGMEIVKEGGDLVVALFIVAQQKTETTASSYNYGGYGYGGYYGYGPGYGWGGGYTTTTYDTYEYLEGTLVCSVYDKQTETLVWEGVGTKTISEDPKDRERNIPYAIKMIMAQYPVKPIATK